MSGTDYTQTPNLSLYKPIFNMAVGQWGDLWNSNADTLDTALSTGSGGRFLPLTGGTVSGPLTAGDNLAVKGNITVFNNNPTAWAGGSGVTAPNMPWFSNIVFNGTSSSTQGLWFHQFQITDGIVSSTPNQAHNCLNSQINTAAGMVGIPQAIAGQVVQGGTSGMHAAGSGYNAVVGIFSNYAFYNEGGTSSSNCSGTVFGINPDVMLNSGATYFASLVGAEFNITAYSGSSLFAKWGLTFVKKSGDAVQGFGGLDAGIVFGDQSGTTAYWNYGILFGSEGGYPSMEGGIAIGTRMTAGGHRQALRWNLDFINNTTSAGSFRSPGITIDPTGITYIGSGMVRPDAAGMAIDTGVHLPVSATINAGGSGYPPSSTIPDVAGNIWNITSSGGVVTAATLVQAVPMPSAPATVALIGGGYYGAAGGAVLNVTYSAFNTLTLQPSGGTIKAPLFVNAANDAAAATAGVAVGQLYRNGSVMMQRAA